MTYHENKALLAAVAVSILVFLTSLPYMMGLGFYNDDWAFLSSYQSAHDQSLFSLVRTGWSPMERMRPAKIVYQASLYRLFSFEPLGYHAVNSVVIALAAAMMTLLMRQIGFSQAKSVAFA